MKMLVQQQGCKHQISCYWLLWLHICTCALAYTYIFSNCTYVNAYLAMNNTYMHDHMHSLYIVLILNLFNPYVLSVVLQVTENCIHYIYFSHS